MIKKYHSILFVLELNFLIGSKNLTLADVNPALEKMKDHLIAKNVASDIAIKLCDSVAAKLEGKVLGTRLRSIYLFSDPHISLN